jgi:hypothetical protein
VDPVLVWITLLRVVVGCAIPVLAAPLPLTPPSGETSATDRHGTAPRPGWTQTDVTLGASGSWRSPVPGAVSRIPAGDHVAFLQRGARGARLPSLPEVLPAHTPYDWRIGVGQAALEPLRDGPYAVHRRARGRMLAEVGTPTPGIASMLAVSLASPTEAGPPLLGHTQACSALACL